MLTTMLLFVILFFMADVIAMWLVVDVKPIFNINSGRCFCTVAGGIANFCFVFNFHVHFNG